MRGKGGKANGRNLGITIIRREEMMPAAHHGGAWKVAYADFVTAMMAFFLLMWLLNATTEDQRKGLADYFSPNNLLSHASSGTGQPFGGHTVYDQGAMVSDRGAVQVVVGKRPVVEDPADDDADTPLLTDRHGATTQAGTTGKADAGTPSPTEAHPAAPGASNRQVVSRAATSPEAANPGSASSGATNPGAADPGAANPGAANMPATPPADAALVVALAETPVGNHVPSQAELRAGRAAREKQAFEQAAEQLRQAVQGDPALAGLARQLAIDITPEGLRIQLLDEDGLPMFTTGSAAPNARAQLLLAKVAPVLMRLPEDIAVVGHTDAAPFAGTAKTNWELSTERANATRRLLTDGGLAEARISRVTGVADRDPLLPADPLAAANRRIAIIVLRGSVKPGEPRAASAAASAGASSIAAPAQSPATAAGSTPGQPAATTPTLATTPGQPPVTQVQPPTPAMR
jgi:chemotaxis protein MotB